MEMEISLMLKVSTRQERAEKIGEDIRLEKKRDFSQEGC
jgi:hypothetical protein